LEKPTKQPFGSHKVVKAEEGYHRVEPVVDEDSLFSFYTDTYYQHSLGTYSKQYSDSELESFRGEHGLRCEALSQASGLASGAFLDVGCGEGFEMSFMAAAGWEVTGTDFSSDGMRHHHPELLDKLLVGPIEESLAALEKGGKLYEYIYLGNVLEHLPNPEEVMKRVRTLLTKHGVVAIRVPNDFSVLQTYLLENSIVERPYWISIPEHLNYFNPIGIENFLSSLDFVILDAFASFPIDWFLAHERSNYIEEVAIGKSVHSARLALENLIYSTSAQRDILDFYRGLFKIGMGRNLTVIAKGP
jgi:2-polyprenyl-3-methyl-5-hydroxy-6-metoxy-1,4-benzoquinol methylase